MAKNKISDLRDHLFETIEALKDKDTPMDLDRAKTISEVAQTIINVAKVEVDMAKASGAAPSGGFFQLPAPAEPEDRDVTKHAHAIDQRRQLAAAAKSA